MKVGNKWFVIPALGLLAISIEERRRALARQRRVIFNDDTYELSRDDANTPEPDASTTKTP